MSRRDRQRQQQQAVNSPANQAKFAVTRETIAADYAPYYDIRSQIILLRDRNGIVHRSQLAGEQLRVQPNPEIHDVLWFHFQEDEGDMIEDLPTPTVKGVIQGHCYLIPRRDRDPHVEAVNNSMQLNMQVVRDGKEQRTTIPGAKGTGIAMGQEEGNIYMIGPGNTELVIGRDSISSTHQIDSTAMRKKGLFAENPLASVIPQTIVTFPAAMQEFPDPNRIVSIASSISGVTNALKTLKSLTKLFG